LGAMGAHTSGAVNAKKSNSLILHFSEFSANLLI
jgi:hypothetical protein